MSSTPLLTVIGGGLAGCEAALVLAALGHRVRLIEMKPVHRTPAQSSDRLAELVCSNSLRSDNPENAIGLLHEELRRLGSPILTAADRAKVPAGDALAVDRTVFSDLVEQAIAADPRIERVTDVAQRLPADGSQGLTLMATGPLTAPELAADLQRVIGQQQLAFYDAIAPIVAGDSIDLSIAFAQSRYDKGEGADYLNLPFNREEYDRFVDALLGAQKVVPHAFEEARYFEGCLPIEVMAERGRQVLAFGPMKPVGLEDPRTGRRPYAVVQLRREDVAGTCWNLVGFQTRMTWPEQRRIFREFVPGLANAEFVRLGQVHRNTFVQGPQVLAPDLSLRAAPHIFLGGQITGVEGYVESAACGHLAARAIHARLQGHTFEAPPTTTALGALHGHVTGAAHLLHADYQPSNCTWGLFPPLEGRIHKHDRKKTLLARARTDIDGWLAGPGAAVRTAVHQVIDALPSPSPAPEQVA